MKLIFRIGQVLVRPKQVFPIVKEEKLGKACWYLVILQILASIPLMIASAIIYNLFFEPVFMEATLPLIRGAFILSMFLVPNIAIVIGILLKSLVLMLFLRLLGEKINYGQTLRAMIYSLTPFILTYWLVPISVGTLIWSLVLLVKSLTVMYAVQKKRVWGVYLIFLMIGVVFGLVVQWIVR